MALVDVRDANEIAQQWAQHSTWQLAQRRRARYTSKKVARNQRHFNAAITHRARQTTTCAS
jgi:hypothetical protein